VVLELPQGRARVDREHLVTEGLSVRDVARAAGVSERTAKRARAAASQKKSTVSNRCPTGQMPPTKTPEASSEGAIWPLGQPLGNTRDTTCTRGPATSASAPSASRSRRGCRGRVGRADRRGVTDATRHKTRSRTPRVMTPRRGARPGRDGEGDTNQRCESAPRITKGAREPRRVHQGPEERGAHAHAREPVITRRGTPFVARVAPEGRPRSVTQGVGAGEEPGGAEVHEAPRAQGAFERANFGYPCGVPRARRTAPGPRALVRGDRLRGPVPRGPAPAGPPAERPGALGGPPEGVPPGGAARRAAMPRGGVRVGRPSKRSSAGYAPSIGRPPGGGSCSTNSSGRPRAWLRRTSRRAFGCTAGSLPNGAVVRRC
jgi:hypothetical protein